MSKNNKPEELTGYELNRLHDAVKAYTIGNGIFDYKVDEVRHLYGISRTTYYRYRNTSYYRLVQDSAREAEKRGQRLTVDKLEEIAQALKDEGILETYKGTQKQEEGE